MINVTIIWVLNFIINHISKLIDSNLNDTPINHLKQGARYV